MPPAHALHLPTGSAANHPASGREASVWVLLALVAGLWLAPAQARDPRSRDGDDHDRALQAVQAGEVLPLATVLQRVPALQKGQVLEVELEREHGRWVYEIKLLQPDGRLMTFEIDARTATLTGQNGPSRGR